MGAHGWHTEWPRIREVTGGRYLMNMHGGWFAFPPGFAAGKTGGLRPLGDYLKITGDFCGWNGRIVFGCDDTALMGVKSGVGDTLNGLIGQSNSNLWFTTWERLSQAGRPAGFGGPWLGENVRAGVPSVPYLLAGYTQRVLHLAHHAKEPFTLAMEIDKAGDGRWVTYKTLTFKPEEGYAFHLFPADLDAAWIRLKTDRDVPGVTAYFHYGPGGGAAIDRTPFAALADVDQPGPWTAAVMRSEGADRITLGVLARSVDASGKLGTPATYQVDAELKFHATAADSPSARFLAEKVLVKNRVVSSDAASVIVTEGKLRVRLPKAHAGYDAPWATGWPRALREVVTERSLLNAAGSFFLLPRENSGGLRRLKPICTHNKRITDFCSWRGLLVVAGCAASARPDGHYFAAADGRAGLWFGDLDDLWKLGKPVGRGGPWLNTPVEAGTLSDPYLMAGYDRKTLALSHDANSEVSFTILVDVAGDGVWFPYAKLRVPAGQTVTHAFPAGYSAHWVRLKPNRPAKATAMFQYE
jgi:hypothetical protein